MACLDVNIAYMDVGKGRELGAEALKTRFSRCAQVIAACRSAGDLSEHSSSGSFLTFPRFDGVTCARHLLFGANTP